MLIRLDSSGHYPTKVVEISNDEWQQIQQLTKSKYLQDTAEGLALIRVLDSRPLQPDIPTLTIYC